MNGMIDHRRAAAHRQAVLPANAVLPYSALYCSATTATSAINTILSARSRRSSGDGAVQWGRLARWYK